MFDFLSLTNHLIVIFGISIAIVQFRHKYFKERVNSMVAEMENYIVQKNITTVIKNSETIKSTYDDIKNFSVTNIWQIMITFYSVITISACITSLDASGVFTIIAQRIENAWVEEGAKKIYTIITIWLAPIGLFYVIIFCKRLKKEYEEFCKSYHSFLTQIDILTYWSQ